MAVSEQTPYIEYTANGVTTSFALEFDCDNKDHLIVLIDDLDPVVGAWSLVDGAVNFSIAPANNAKITIKRNTPFSRESDFQSYDNSFRPKPVNADFDRIWWKLQELGLDGQLLKAYVQYLNTKQKQYIDEQDSSLNSRINNIDEKADGVKNYASLINNNLRIELLSVLRGIDQHLDDVDLLIHQIFNRFELIESTNVANNLFSTIADGIANTKHGEFFTVISSNENNYSDLYKNINGVAVDQNKSYPSANKVNLISHAVGITPRHFGGKPNDPEFDNRYALQACSNSNLPIVLDGFYYTTEAPIFKANATIRGLGETKSGIVKVGNAESTGGAVAISSGASDNYNVDAILIIQGEEFTSDTIYAKNVSFESFSLLRHNCLSVVINLYGLFAPRLAQSKITNVPVLNTLNDGTPVGYGIRVVNGWMLSWDRIDSRAIYPFHFGSDSDGFGYYNGGGTSNTFVSCWAKGGKKSAWRFRGMTYSNLISCGGDFIGEKGVGGTIVYDFEACYMGMINCSSEQIHGRLVRANDSSSILVLNPHFEHGVYGDGTLNALVHTSGYSKCTILGGKIKRQDDATNPPYRSQYNSILRVIDVEENFDFTIHRGEFAPNKNVAVLFNGTSQFIHEKGITKRSWVFDKSLFQPSETDSYFKTSASIELTSSTSKLKITSFTACEYKNPLQLGRGRLWRAVINDASALMFKIDSDPESIEDGVLLNLFRGNITSFPAAAIAGQFCIRENNKPYWRTPDGWRDANGTAFIANKPTIVGKKNPTTIAEQNEVLNSIVSALTASGIVIDART